MAAKADQLLTQSSPNARTFIAISAAMLGSMMFGIDVANFGTTSDFDSFLEYWCVPHFGGVDSCTREAAAINNGWQYEFLTWSNVLIPLGSCLGGITIGKPIANVYGRRPCISLGCGITFVGSLISAFLCGRSKWIFYLSRFITGYGVGMSCYALPMYNSEMATPGIRGATGGFFQMFLAVGQLIAAFTVNSLPADAESSWRIGMFLPGIAGIIVSILVWCVPESPRFIMQKKGYDACTAILQRVRTGDVEAEARSIQDAIQASKPVSFGELLSEPSLRRRLLVALIMQACQQATGFNALLGYWGTYCTKLGIEDPTTTNVIFTVVQLVGVACAVALIDSRFGARKGLLLTSTTFMVPAMLLIGFTARYGWSANVAKFGTYAYGFGFQLAWGMVCWVYPSEIFSMAERASAIGIVVFFQYIMNVGIYFLSPILIKWSIEYTAWVFTSINMVNFAFILIAVKETKGKPLESIPALFGAAEADSLEQ